MPDNRNLNAARRRRNDEFYTRDDIADAELSRYDWAGRSVICDCDDLHSAFARWFSTRFKRIGLERLTQVGRAGLASITTADGTKTLEVNGDFRSADVAALRAASDTVVTNPPWSLFDEHMALAAGDGRDVLTLGQINAVGYRHVFDLILAGRLGPGANFNKYLPFDLPDGGERKVKGSCWLTTMPHSGGVEPLKPTRRYDPADYPEFDDYRAINVNRSKDIPVDYAGAMGVPVSFFKWYDPNLFELLDAAEWRRDPARTPARATANNPHVGGRAVFKRILIRWRAAGASGSQGRGAPFGSPTATGRTPGRKSS